MKYKHDLERFVFVLCPWGNGFDTHRIWETLYSGSIPVIKKHKTFEYLEGLPALFIDNYEDLLDIVDFFSTNSDPNIFKERHALSQSEFRKLIQPLIRTGHIVQDFRGGFRTVAIKSSIDPTELRKEYLRNMVKEFPIITLKQFMRLAGTPFKPEEIKSVLN